MCYSKEYPGEIECPYVAGMNTLSLPTTTFPSPLSVAEANKLGDTGGEPLGSYAYLLLMWCPAMTAIFGSGKAGEVPSSEKLGGLVIK